MNERQAMSSRPPSERFHHRQLAPLIEEMIDPDDWDSDGRRLWLPLGCPRASVPFQTETELDQIRRECRQLANENEFAINGHENRISYVVGTGHRYQIVPRPGHKVSKSTLSQAQTVLERFLKENRWQHRQQEILRRKDRDGEAFLRFFPGPDGILRVRFLDPDDVRTPARYSRHPEHSFGIATDPADVETVHGYWVNDTWVPAGEVQHRKANVDANIKRGLPMFYPVRKNLRRAEKLLRNMSVVAGLQSAVALIRKHAGGRASVERFLSDAATTVSSAPSASSPYTTVQRFAPGTILDATAGVDYEFPVAAIDAARYVTLLQAELRAVASRLVMPEFMLTSDASNANYASTLVAEGPAVKMFQRLQAEMIEEDRVVLERALETAAEADLLPADILDHITIKTVPPSLVVRDRLKEAQADAILFRCGALSRETLALRHNLEPNDNGDPTMDEPIV